MSEHDFEQLFWRFYPELLRHARAQVGDSSAEDLVAETMATLWRKDIRLPADESEVPAVRALAYQVLSGHIRNERRATRRRSALTTRVESLVAAHADESEAAASAAVDDAVSYWLGQLSGTDREVILLFNAGFSNEETATVLGCSPEAAAKRRGRARERLRKIVEADRGVAR